MDTKTYIFIIFYQQYLVLCTIALRDSSSRQADREETTRARPFRVPPFFLLAACSLALFEGRGLLRDMYLPGAGISVSKGGTWQAIKPATDQWRVGDTCHAACGRARVQMQVCLRSHWATRRGNCLCSAWDNALDSSLHVLKLYKTIYIYRYYIVPPPKTYIHIIASTYRDFLFPLELPNVRLPGVSGDSGN